MPAPAKIMLIRHAEKPVDPPPDGVDENGATNKHSLTVRGWQRAGALVPFFESPYRAGIERPSSIFASGTSTPGETLSADDAISLRPQHTILPVSRKLGITPNTAIAVGEEEALVATIRSTNGVVLVSWEHKRISLIAGGFMKNPPQWDDRYDVVWILDRVADDDYRFSEVAQQLLDGDSPV